MIRRILIVGVLAVLATVAAVPVYASHVTEGTVNATVTPGVFSVSVSGTPAYGTVDLGSTDVEPSGQNCGSSTGAAFTATNNGTVSSAYVIKGANSVVTGTGWTLAGVAGNDAYVHRFSVNPPTCDYTALTTSNTSLSTSVAGSGGSVDVYLNLDAPTDTTTASEHTLPVVVTATSAS